MNESASSTFDALAMTYRGMIAMVMATFSGVIIPVMLLSMGQEPAQSSPGIIMTVTDVVGLLAFQGIDTFLSGIL